MDIGKVGLKFLHALRRAEDAGRSMAAVPDLVAELGFDGQDRALVWAITEPLCRDGLVVGIGDWRVGLRLASLTTTGRALTDSVN
jgi:hypothetical protein